MDTHRLVKMTSTKRGSPDGITVTTYEANVVYNLPIDLAVVFVEQMMAAKYHTEAVKVGPSETRVDEVDAVKVDPNEHSAHSAHSETRVEDADAAKHKKPFKHRG